MLPRQLVGIVRLRQGEFIHVHIHTYTYVHVCPSVKYQEKEYVDARKGVIKHSP